MKIGYMLKSILPDKIFAKLKFLYLRNKKHISQMGQDYWVFGEVFDGKKKGYFVEIGSADGMTLNNTLLLETRYNWNGICIEPNPSLFKTLSQIRKVTCLNICIDEREGIVEFKQDGLMGGIVSYETDNKPEIGPSKGDSILIKLQTQTLFSVLSNYNAPKTIDYLSIDAEGAEERILNKFPFNEYKFTCITIERPSQLLRDLFEKHGYVKIKEIPGLDVFYIHKEFLPEYHVNVIRYWGKRT